MFDRLGSFVVNNSKKILVGYLIAITVAGIVGAGMFGSLKSQGYDDLGSDSAAVDTILRKDFDAHDASAILVIDTGSNIDSEVSKAAATEILANVSKEKNIESIVSYWSSGNPTELKSKDGNAGLALVYFNKNISESESAATAAHIQETYDKATGSNRTYVGGLEVLYHAINSQIKTDLTKAESIAIPLNILMLFIVFGAAIAAGLPMIVALGSITGSFFVIYLITRVTDVSIFALNLITGLGLGLGIDYALLIVNRYREELNRTSDVKAAVARTINTAGRTVFFSGLTVALVLASMLVFPQYFLDSFAYAGVSVVLFAVLSSLIALPAVLNLLGTNVDKFKVRRGDLKPREDGAWSWLARNVMRRPTLVIFATLGIIFLSAAPALNVKLSQVDDRVLPAANPAAIASAQIRERFDNQAPIEVVIPTAATTAEVDKYARELSTHAGIISVLTSDIYIQSGKESPLPPDQGVKSSANFHRITMFSSVPSRAIAAQNQIADLRSVPAPVAGTLIGGQSAVFTDSQAGISSHLGIVFAWLSIATLVILFLFTGSVILPIKAVLLNLASLSATLGLLVWVFQEGNAHWLVGNFTVTGALDTSTLVLVAIVAFGLSMDYELFLLSRIKEEHDAGASTTEAVSRGLQKSGRIITAAAILIAIVFACFITSGVTSIKMLGLGIAFAIMIDATIVRGLLVPALMRVAGDWNWWAPAPLRQLHNRFGITE